MSIRCLFDIRCTHRAQCEWKRTRLNKFFPIQTKTRCEHILSCKGLVFRALRSHMADLLMACSKFLLGFAIHFTNAEGETRGKICMWRFPTAIMLAHVLTSSLVPSSHKEDLLWFFIKSLQLSAKQYRDQCTDRNLLCNGWNLQQNLHRTH